MKKNIFKSFFENETDKLNFIRNGIIGENKFSYFDYTASGLGFQPLEDRVHQVLETYANTHSKESLKADTTSHYYNQARINLASHLELDDNFAILPSGCGATSAIKHFQEIIGLYIPPATKQRYNIEVSKDNLPLVIVGPYEHHSNEVSFREALCEVIRIGLLDNGLVDLKHLEEVLQKNKNREIIASFCVASNVSGIVTPYKEISNILRKYNAIICFDAAASSPYMNIECKYYDAIFMSPHKLLGGPGSCGILAMRKNLVDTSIAPTFSGGGTVEYVNKNIQVYEKNIEIREDSGTPGIIQLIRASLAYQLRNEIGFDFIKSRKEELSNIFITELKKIKSCQIYGNLDTQNIGIISFNIKDVDPYLLCSKLSNGEGFETRAGCSCAGPYGHDLLGIENLEENEKPGWVRISIHFSHTKEDILKISHAINTIYQSLTSP